MFTASTWTAPSDLADRLAATLVATAAMSTSPLMRALETAWLSASTVAVLITGDASPLATASGVTASLSAISLAAPTPVGPDRTMTLGST